MLTYKTILTKLEENKATIKKYGVKEFGLFGSFLRNEQKSTSDIDILVEFDSEINLSRCNARPLLLHTHARRITMDGAQGFHDGAGFIKMIYDKYDEIKIWRI